MNSNNSNITLSDTATYIIGKVDEDLERVSGMYCGRVQDGKARRRARRAMERKNLKKNQRFSR